MKTYYGKEYTSENGEDYYGLGLTLDLKSWAVGFSWEYNQAWVELGPVAYGWRLK